MQMFLQLAIPGTLLTTIFFYLIMIFDTFQLIKYHFRNGRRDPVMCRRWSLLDTYPYIVFYFMKYIAISFFYFLSPQNEQHICTGKPQMDLHFLPFRSREMAWIDEILLWGGENVGYVTCFICIEDLLYICIQNPIMLSAAIWGIPKKHHGKF